MNKASIDDLADVSNIPSLAQRLLKDPMHAYSILCLTKIHRRNNYVTATKTLKKVIWKLSGTQLSQERHFHYIAVMKVLLIDETQVKTISQMYMHQWD